MLVWVRDFERINGCFTFTSGVLLNTVLIMLVIKKSSKELQSYNRMLLTNCGFDLFLNIATFLPQLQVEAVDGVFFFVINSVLKRLPIAPFHYLMAATGATAMHLVIAFLPAQYYYRYKVLKTGRVLSGMELVFVMFLVLFSGVGTGILCFNAVWQTGLNGINYSHLLDNELWREADGKLPKYAAADSAFWPMKLYFSFAIINNFIAYNIVFTLIWKTSKLMKRNESSFSSKTKKLQRQLALSLLIQTLAPVFTVFTPSNVFITSTFLGINLYGFGCVAVAALSWISVINPLSTLLLVGQYRQEIFGRFERKVSTVQLSTTQNPSVA